MTMFISAELQRISKIENGPKLNMKIFQNCKNLQRYKIFKENELFLLLKIVSQTATWAKLNFEFCGENWSLKVSKNTYF